MMRIQLRVYMGAMLVAPENITILNDIKHAGLVGGHGSKVSPFPTAEAPQRYTPWTDDGNGDDLFFCAKLKKTKWHELFQYNGATPKDPLFEGLTRDIYAAEWAEARAIEQGNDSLFIFFQSHKNK